jgi:heterodisulfide reductase subunit A
MNQEVKLGIFICDCGATLAKNIDFTELKQKLETLPDVEYLSISHSLCSPEGQETMLSELRAKAINRVVVAACSSELYEHIFAALLEKAGLNPYLLSMANIREQCSWVTPDKDKATQKAMEQIKMAINRARLLEPVESKDVPVNKEVLVVGGGIAGMQTALELSQLNLKATLMEKGKALGGKLSQLVALSPLKSPPEELLAAKVKAVTERNNVEVLTSAELLTLNGQAGDFAAKITKDGQEFFHNFGAVIIATGNEAQFPSQIYGVELSSDIVSQEQLEAMLRLSTMTKVPNRVCFILDVCGEHSRTHTISALETALILRRRFGSEVYIVCQNLEVDSSGIEQLYREARNRGVLFLKFEQPPRISRDNAQINVQFQDSLTANEEVIISCDLLVLESKLLPPHEAQTVSSMLNIGLGPGDFYQEDNVHLFPVNSAKKGIFFAGNCHTEIDLSRVLTEASNAALNAYQLLSTGKIATDVGRVTVAPGKCTLCLTCIRYCPHGAIRVDHENRTAQIIDIACEACGICAGVCPAKAITFKDNSDEQIWAELEVIGERR